MCHVLSFFFIHVFFSLRQLNLEKNELYFVPQLMVLDGRVKTSDEDLSSKQRKKSGGPSSQHSHMDRIKELLEQRIENTPRGPMEDTWESNGMGTGEDYDGNPENSDASPSKTEEENSPSVKPEESGGILV